MSNVTVEWRKPTAIEDATMRREQKPDSASPDGSRPGENPLPPPPDSADPPGEMHKPPEKCGHFSELQLLYTNFESDE